MNITKYISSLPDLTGKVAVTTGTGGIGYEIANVLAAKGAYVIIAGRNAEKGFASVEKIKKFYPDANITFELLDLADFSSIESFSKKILQSDFSAIDILVCNAGVMIPPTGEKTKDGMEMQFGVNYLGHFALTGRLLPLLKKSKNARVITSSSIANLPWKFDLADAQCLEKYSSSRSYAFSKLCCLMFALELQKRSTENNWGISAYGVHPGLAKTKLFSYGKSFIMYFLRVIFFVLPFIRHSAASAARPALFAATSDKAVPGGYYGPVIIGFVGPPVRALLPPRARNKAKRTALWTLSEELTGINFNE